MAVKLMQDTVVYLLTTEGSDTGWGKPKKVFSTMEKLLSYVKKEMIKFASEDGAIPLLDTLKINKKFDKGEGGLILDIEMSKREKDDYICRCGLGRVVYKMTLR
jgi:hypothetical protein